MHSFQRRRSHTTTSESDRPSNTDRRSLRNSSFSKETTLNRRTSLPPGLQQKKFIRFLIRRSLLESPSTGKSWLKRFSSHSSKQYKLFPSIYFHNAFLLYLERQQRILIILSNLI